MIVVIADDFTGASEIAGIALEFGLKVRIQTELDVTADLCDVLVVDTNTRSMEAVDSVRVLEKVMEWVYALSPELLYKKTDSVLRGNIKDELSTVLHHYPDKSVLLVPANPSMGRTIRFGTYYVDGDPINESVFSKDPECPAVVADVIQLIERNTPGDDVKLLAAGEATESGVIYVPDITDQSDVIYWANRLQENRIAAGAADFFRAILSGMGHTAKPTVTYQYDFQDSKSLIVCGSSLSNIDRIKAQMVYLEPRIAELAGLDACIDKAGSELDELADYIVGGFINHQTVVVLLKMDKKMDHDIIQKLPSCLAGIVSRVISKTTVHELFVEGGTSSSEIVRKIGWKIFEPSHVIGEGIIRMNVTGSDVHLTVKPGSYKWPTHMWTLAVTGKNKIKPY
ncbi:MAG: four-carbon acid sugar kinase family protein [Cyclonatronaceae bacterium]